MLKYLAVAQFPRSFRTHRRTEPPCSRLHYRRRTTFGRQRCLCTTCDTSHKNRARACAAPAAFASSTERCPPPSATHYPVRPPAMEEEFEDDGWMGRHRSGEDEVSRRPSITTTTTTDAPLVLAFVVAVFVVYMRELMPNKTRDRAHSTASPNSRTAPTSRWRTRRRCSASAC